MNCKPFDMVIGIKDIRETCQGCGGPIVFKLAGKITQVTVLQSETIWQLAEPLPIEVTSNCGNATIYAGGIADEYLRPLNDKPGDDESLSWKPVPTKETA